MILALNGLEVDCVIGDLPEERARVQRLVVDASLETGDAASRSDSLADTADYAALAGRIRERLVAGRCRMIERAARLAAEACVEDPRVVSARVRVTKPGAVAGLGSASAEAVAGAGAACPEYELAGIETIARGVCVVDGRLLLCRAKGGKSTYLPGGHIEFGESGREALVREIREETGLDSSAGAFLGAVENKFMQHGRLHAEINLVYELKLAGAPGDVRAAEDWIEFEWRPLGGLADANLLPEAFRALGENPKARFEP